MPALEMGHGAATGFTEAICSIWHSIRTSSKEATVVQILNVSGFLIHDHLVIGGVTIFFLFFWMTGLLHAERP